MKNPVQYRYFIKGELELLSPLIIGSGEDEIADFQCQRDWDGNLFIPGTTIAGNLRHYLQSNAIDTGIIKRVFGSSENQAGYSLLTFYDAPSTDDAVKTIIRDGIRLDNLTKTVADKSKYDFETIPTGTIFYFRMEGSSRKNNDYVELEASISKIIELLENSKIRFGAKVQRGFGKLKLNNVNIKKLDLNKKDHIQNWINFQWDFTDKEVLDPFKIKEVFSEKNAILLCIHFDIPDTFIIRSYSMNPEDEDSISMQENGIPVIPGTAWNGSIRHALENISRELNKINEMDKFTKNLFGYVDVENKIKPVASRILIEESKIYNTQKVTYVRNKVDRFTSGTVDTALFDEQILCKGNTCLEIEIVNPDDFEIGMILLAIKELSFGIQTVGGEANVGRGRLNGGTIKMDVSGNIVKKSEADYLNALATELNKEN